MGNLKVQTVTAEMSPDAVEKLWEELTKKHLGHLVHGSTSVEKLGAIVAIGASYPRS